MDQVISGKKTELFQALFQAAQDQNLPLAFWRLPKSEEIHFIADISGRTAMQKIDLEELPAGFAFSPFLNPDGKHTLFIKASLHYILQDDQLSGPARLADEATSETLKAFQKKFQQNLEKFSKRVPGRAEDNTIIAAGNSPRERDYFTDMVARGRRAIAKGSFQKVVLSRTKTVQLPESYNPADTFHSLCQFYPQAFVSWVSVPGTAMWMGASPEILISIDKQQMFRTVSLAGTQPYRAQIPVSRAVWTQKEIEEQALVSRYIVNCFKKIRLREYDEIGPKTVIAGNLMHLRTDFTVDMQAVVFPQLGTQMLELLHPTSAVCGMPKASALEFILTHEQHQRHYYSGFLGPVHIKQETHLFVNLRCMQLQPGIATLYAGAGITADSNPEREWAETEFKCETLLKVLEKTF